MKNSEHCLAYSLNPYLINKINKINKINTLFPYNEILEINFYKNIIIDLFFLDTPNLAYKSLPLDVLLSDVGDKSQMDLYSKETKELHKLGYGF